MARKTVFVGGAMRSGTTMLYGLVCSSPQTNPIMNECHYLAEQVGLYRHWVSLGLDNNIRDQYFTNLEEFKTYSRELITALIDRFYERLVPHGILVLKSPLLSQYLWQVHELVPDARYIISVRDPRDVIASILVTAGKIKDWKKEARKQHCFGFLADWGRDMTKLSNYFLSFYRPALVIEPIVGDRLMFAKYEKVVQDIPGTVKNVAGILGIEPWEFDNTKPWYPETTKPLRQEEVNNWTTDRYFETISGKSVGNFKTAFSNEELAVIERICADYMTKFGYEPVASA
ncbi:MAG: sulfotransferase [Alphaproteobacteria bacterium]|nr:sulfotransferase [Alphaproteobacteria bacterium]